MSQPAARTSTRLLLVAHASTTAVRRAAFPLDEPLDARGLTQARALLSTLPHAAANLCGPELRTRQTAVALGLPAALDAALHDWVLGRWAGRTLAEVQAEEPDAVAAWLRVPAAAPHGGESLLALLERAAAWLERWATAGGAIIAVTHPAFVRAALVGALDATPAAFWRFDVGPLTQALLVGDGGRWNLRLLRPAAATS